MTHTPASLVMRRVGELGQCPVIWDKGIDNTTAHGPRNGLKLLQTDRACGLGFLELMNGLGRNIELFSHRL